MSKPTRLCNYTGNFILHEIKIYVKIIHLAKIKIFQYIINV